MEQLNECILHINSEPYIEVKQNKSRTTESLEEMAKRFSENEIAFIRYEALKTYFWTENEETSLRALELLERMAGY